MFKLAFLCCILDLLKGFEDLSSKFQIKQPKFTVEDTVYVRCPWYHSFVITLPMLPQTLYIFWRMWELLIMGTDWLLQFPPHTERQSENKLHQQSYTPPGGRCSSLGWFLHLILCCFLGQGTLLHIVSLHPEPSCSKYDCANPGLVWSLIPVSLLIDFPKEFCPSISILTFL